MGRLRDKITVVTGAGRGIGRAIAGKLAGEGATVLIDETSLQYMEGAELDYVEDLIGSAFKISNPQAVAACGCGTSFTV